MRPEAEPAPRDPSPRLSRSGAAPAAARTLEPDATVSIAARRNELAAMWAGRLLGMSGDGLQAYVGSLRSAPEERLAALLRRDLKEAGIAISEDDVAQALCRLHRIAVRQVGMTD